MPDWRDGAAVEGVWLRGQRRVGAGPASTGQRWRALDWRDSAAVGASDWRGSAAVGAPDRRGQRRVGRAWPADPVPRWGRLTGEDSSAAGTARFGVARVDVAGARQIRAWSTPWSCP